MGGFFPVIDLVSQSRAVQGRLQGLPLNAKLAWLAAHGKLCIGPSKEDLPQAYYFESNVGLFCCFFFQGDNIVFIGDNTMFTV